MPPPINGNDSALNAAHSNAMIRTSPIAPIVVGLRELNDLPPTLTRRVCIFGFSSAAGRSLPGAESAISDTSPASTRAG